jgi:hypothetical protein
MKLSRRALVRTLACAGAGAALPFSPAFSAAASRHDADWDWLLGSWDVWHVRLRKRLANNNDWDEFAGKSAFWKTLGGLGNCDENLLHIPTGTYRGLSVRSFDPVTSKWSIWWLDGRMAGSLDPPVVGGFTGDEAEFFGPDVFDGRPVTVRFRWHEVRSKRPHWDQALSTDGGKTWEINWRNYFTRTSEAAIPIPAESPAAAANDWKFLVGRWRAHNRRRTAAGTWEEFESSLHNWTVLGGLGNVGDNVFHAPGGAYRGMSVRAFDADRKVWRSWWLDGRNPSRIDAPNSGTFVDGTGTLLGESEQGGRKILSRSRWTRTESATPRWEQASSSDGGTTWEPNWFADFERASG